ncbi:hypothetical protein Tco_1243338 [Tanacetum coccineum]
MMETTEESDEELWRNQTEWEIIIWRLYESTWVHILELENGTMIHMLAEQRYPLTRERMQRMLEHKLEVQKETEKFFEWLKRTKAMFGFTLALMKRQADRKLKLQSKVEAEAPLGPLSLSGVHSVRTHLILLSQPSTSSDPL